MARITLTRNEAIDDPIFESMYTRTFLCMSEDNSTDPPTVTYFYRTIQMLDIVSSEWTGLLGLDVQIERTQRSHDWRTQGF